MSTRKIDAHAHIGKDLGRKMLGMTYDSDPEKLYELSVDSGVSDVIVAPAPGQIVCPELGNDNHRNGFRGGWIPELVKAEDGYMQFSCGCGQEWGYDDPFKEINAYLLEKTTEINGRGQVTFHPIPIVHPMNQNAAEIVDSYVSQNCIKGIKIHGMIDRTNPAKYINSKLTEAIEDNKLRVLFHTDINDHNRPEAVLDYAEKTGIQSQLAHGCRGNEKSLQRVSGLSNVIVDSSPLQLIHENERLLAKRNLQTYQSLIQHLVKHAGEDSVVAGTDYNWCGWNDEGYKIHWEEFGKDSFRKRSQVLGHIILKFIYRF